jgi:hypothetical protein
MARFLSSSASERYDTLDRLQVSNPPRQPAVLIGLVKKIGDNLFLVHRARFI